jgi:parvulin-like peptidyl-prolyl isomerase
MPQGDVARVFGDGFSKRLSAVEPGRWQGPVSSSFGAHFVLVDDFTKGKLPPLETIRDAVQREWFNARRIEAEDKLYRSLKDKYQVVVETPSRTMAFKAAR